MKGKGRRKGMESARGKTKGRMKNRRERVRETKRVAWWNLHGEYLHYYYLL